jgi:acyl carrier protein
MFQLRDAWLMAPDLDDVKSEVLSFFRMKGDFAALSETDQLRCRYLEGDVLDSLGIVEMVSEFERRFAIQFSMDDLQSEEFQTPAGVIALVVRLKGVPQ